MSEKIVKQILNHHLKSVKILFKWLLLSLFIGSMLGLASAFFLITLEKVTDFRITHLYLIWGLPIGGFLMGLIYHYCGNSVAAGNNLLIETIRNPQKEKIPFKMAPWVYLGTIITHFFGGSAGREGTVLQMAGAIADQFSKPFGLQATDRKLLLIAAIAAGFGSVFGTPLAGTLFALEFFIIGKIRYQALLPALLAAFIAEWVCEYVGAHHTLYHIAWVPQMNIIHLFYAVLVGIVCSLVSQIFSESIHFLSRLYARTITYAPFRPLIGGTVVTLLVVSFSAYAYTGLGIPMIQTSFVNQLPWYTFLFKVIFTVLTLSAGFKGGEVTPLFFIGAALGNVLALFIPLPVSLLAGMGFVAVFAGATKTPLACAIMAIELFGGECGIYAAIACVVSFMFSGRSTIYTSQYFHDEL